MPAKDPDEVLSGLYRDFICQQVETADVQKEKKAFLKAHFAPEPLLFLRPVFLLPLALAVALLVVFPWHKPLDFQPLASKPGVDVLRASSREGSVMVYQKTYQDTPVTIIWVFPTGGHS